MTECMIMLSGSLTSATAGLALGFLLNIFYVSLKHVRLQNYFGLSKSVDPIVSRNIVRWTVFRFVPPVIAAAAASLTAQRAAGFPLVAAAFTIATCRTLD
jgi:hypothetical protein